MKDYQLKFYNAGNLTYEQIDDNYSGGYEIPDIDKEKMDSIIRDLKSKGIKFEVLDDEEDEGEYFIDLSFENYNFSVLDNLIGIVIPLSKKRVSAKVITEIELVIRILIDNDMTGYDRELKTVFGSEYNLSTALTQYSAKSAPVSNNGTAINNGPVVIEENSKSKPLRIILIVLLIFAAIYGVIILLR